MGAVNYSLVGKSVDFYALLRYELSRTVEIAGMSRKRAKITVLLDREEFERFDAYCEQAGFKKSTLIARLIRDHLDEHGFESQRELPLGGSKPENRR